ncbi:hypothetical protein NKOR_03735 [Candidatus Nitrosopumilus koreensis AR1]|uniref:Uncharacterized protein n=1 Tax=Candidatus Nitrosopumilus koreensis AR1 TaxID=1229908 RepID=K0B840_9ARCH|nr:MULTISPECIES: hypothetical protein [Nitrosopumilus]AFS80641.1 hypothetical protein NKOR_03735 [Candidatus Nitrosopumilus koreensis AR1]
MIHPKITQVFSEDKKTNLFFSWVSEKINNANTLQEFFKWHLDVISEVISEIEKTQMVNFSNKNESQVWASEFLENYEEKIRKMRRTSNQIFQRFHELQKEFQRIIPKEHEYHEKSKQVMQMFLNKEELLVGKIIFAYRETWFLANQITDSDFKLGSIENYQKWVETNFSNLKKIKESLEQIQKEISQ